MTKKLLFLHRQPPGPHSRETLDTAMVAAAFDQSVALLFREAGVLQLAEGDAVPAELSESLRLLPEYGVSDIYACADALAAHGLDPARLVVSVRVVTSGDQTDLLAGQHMVVCD